MHMVSSLAVAAASCLEQLDEMADAYVREVRKLPGYLPTTVSESDLRTTAAETLHLLLGNLLGRDGTARLATLSEDLGRRRARQGIALDSLLRAVRMDFRFLWESLRSQIAYEQQADLGTHVVAVWEAV